MALKVREQGWKMSFWEMSPLQHHQGTLLSHNANWEERCLLPHTEILGISGALNPCKAFSEITVRETALCILLFISCLQLFSIPGNPPPSESQGKTWQSKGQHRQHQEKSRGSREILFHPFLTALIYSVRAGLLYFAFYTGATGVFLHFSPQGNGPVQF